MRVMTDMEKLEHLTTTLLAQIADQPMDLGAIQAVLGGERGIKRERALLALAGTGTPEEIVALGIMRCGESAEKNGWQGDYKIADLTEPDLEYIAALLALSSEDKAMAQTQYQLTMWDGQVTVRQTIDAVDLDDAWLQAEDLAEDWARDGEWGDEGTVVTVYLGLESAGHTYPRRSIDVEIEPNHKALMRAAGADPDCDHEWTAEGEDGDTQNPGVWALGGTALVISTHCVHCGLRRVEHLPGSQRDPGEHDTVEYSLPL
jgi:hypothetical protein